MFRRCHPISWFFKVAYPFFKQKKFEFFRSVSIMRKKYFNESQKILKEKDIKVAIIDNAIDHSIYNPIRHWKIWLNRDFAVFRAPEKRFPDLKDFSHLILTGSEASILEREQWVDEEIKLVKGAADMGLSILGSCYGHQLLAVALAGPRHVQKSAHPEIGWIPVQISKNNGFMGKSGQAYAFSSHLDEVIDLPENFKVLASSENCAIQALRLKEKPIWGLQIHPEMNISEALIYLKNRVENRHAPGQLFKQALDSEPRDSGLIRHVVRRFCGQSR
jgi:GMP synthase-like glutamine amidotransferase